MLVVPPSRPEGTVDLTLIRASQEIVFRPWVWHPDQVPYVVVWRDLVEDPSGFLPRQVKVLAAAEDWPTKTPSVPKPEILQGGTQRRRLFPSSLYPDPGALIPLPAPLPIQPAPPPPVPVALEGGLAYGTHSCRGDTPDPTQGPEYVPSGRQDP